MKWILPKSQEKDLYSTLIKSRNIQDLHKFLNPTIEHIHDPMLMHGVKEAAEIILKTIENKKKIFIHGDFDVDGITATTVMWRYLYHDLGANVLPYIPNRFNEGYGLSDESIQSIIDDGGDLIITVDCGIKDVEIVSKYKDKIDFIITDHHTVLSNDKTIPNLQLPMTKQVGKHLISADALAVVHPQIGDYPFHEICGAMVSWKLCCGINALSETKTDMNKYLDLVSLGTVCDVMPLIDENRAVVALGLELLKKTENRGLQALIEASSVQPEDLKSYHYGYVLGPRLNAAGRLTHALDAVRLLSTNSPSKAQSMAQKLNEINVERQNLTKKYISIAEEQINEKGDMPVYFVYGENWPEGIVGLIAGRLTQSKNRPVLAGSILENGNIKGSARSIEQVHIANTLKSLDDLLIKHGGHAQAAGFTLPYSNVNVFEDELLKDVSTQIEGQDLTPSIVIDAITDISELTFELIEQLQNLEPFGNSNEEPIVGLRELQIKNFLLLGKDKKHLKLDLIDDSFNSIEAICFNAPEEFKKLASSPSGKVSVAGKIGINEWNGRKKIQLKIEDLINA